MVQRVTLTGKERSRRWRQRQSEGVRVIPVEVSDIAIRNLVQRGYLQAVQDEGELRICREDISKAVAVVLKGEAN